jgi:hypothetical protein
VYRCVTLVIATITHRQAVAFENGPNFGAGCEERGEECCTTLK